MLTGSWATGSQGELIVYHWSVIHPLSTHLNFNISWGQVANLDQILFEASLGWRKGCIRFGGRWDENSGFHGNRKLPLTWGKCCPINNYFIFERSFIKLAGNEDIHKISDRFDFGPDRTLELLALEWQKIFLWTYNGENVVWMIATSLLIGSSSILQVTRTAIKSWMSSNSGQIGLSTSELAVLEWQKSPYLTLSDR